MLAARDIAVAGVTGGGTSAADGSAADGSTADGATADGSAADAAMPSTAVTGATKFDWRVSISRSLSSCNWMCWSTSALSLCGGRFVLGVYCKG